MATWTSTYKCTDCGRDLEKPGTCTDCLIKNQPVPEKLKEDIGKAKPKRRGRK